MVMMMKITAKWMNEGGGRTRNEIKEGKWTVMAGRMKRLKKAQQKSGKLIEFSNKQRREKGRNRGWESICSVDDCINEGQMRSWVNEQQGRRLRRWVADRVSRAPCVLL